jgi:phosphoinositide-3-kinase regulatory subunit 4
MEDDTTTVLIRNTYDADLAVLHEVVLRWVVHITTDTSDHSSQSKHALLDDLPRLCNFFGAEYSFQILPQILAFFNDRKDWQLRASLCRHLPTICVVVGRAATEQFVVPCIESALNDNEEQVVIEALACLTTLISTSLLTRTSLMGTEAQPASLHSDGRPRREKQGVIRKSAALLLHPLDSVRQNAACFIHFCWNHLSDTDTNAFAAQILQPYLQYNPSFESVHHLVSCLKAPTMSLDHASSKEAKASSIAIDGEIEYSLKLARSLSVPSQWFNEAALPVLPTWYETLQRAYETNPSLTDPYFSLGIKAFEQGEIADAVGYY